MRNSVFGECIAFKTIKKCHEDTKALSAQQEAFVLLRAFESLWQKNQTDTLPVFVSARQLFYKSLRI